MMRFIICGGNKSRSMASTTQAVLLLCLVPFCAAAVDFVPKVLNEKVSQLSEQSAIKIRDEIVSGASISKELCKEAGFICGPLVYSSKDLDTYSVSMRKLTQEDTKEAHDKALVLFFTLKLLSSRKLVVLPPLTDSQSLQANKFPHPTLVNYLTAMSVPQLLRATGFDIHADQGRKVRENWEICNDKLNSISVQGEKKKCLYSPAEVFDYVSSLLKSDKFEFATASRKVADFEKFELMESTLLSDRDFVTCHTMWFPYGLFMCHTLPKTLLYEVTLKDMNGGKVTVHAVCHMDTSEFAPDHIAFKVLKAGPGKTEMCHWMPSAHIAWYIRD